MIQNPKGGSVIILFFNFFNYGYWYNEKKNVIETVRSSINNIVLNNDVFLDCLDNNNAVVGHEATWPTSAGSCDKNKCWHGTLLKFVLTYRYKHFLTFLVIELLIHKQMQKKIPIKHECSFSWFSLKFILIGKNYMQVWYMMN